MSTTLVPSRTDAPEVLDVHPSPQPVAGRARTLALVSLLLSVTMELLDLTIVNVALPTIEAALGASASMLQWVVAAYPLAFGIALITGARLGDRFGRKRLFVLGLIGFTIASAACGFAPSIGALVAFRVLQGLAAAAMVPQVLTSIQVMYAPHERGLALGLFSGLAGIAAVLGPIIGAVLTEGPGWRAVFLVNVPVGLIAIAAAVRFIPESRAERPARIDLRGVAVLSGGLFAILYPLTMGHELGWPIWTYAAMLAGLVVLGFFVAAQRRHERTGDEPLVATALYAGRAFTGGSLVAASMFVTTAGYFLASTLYFQIGLGWSVLKAGLVNLPFAIVCTVTAGLGATVLLARLGRRVLALGAAIMVLGFAVLALVVRSADAMTSVWAFVPGLAIVGAGFGFVVSSAAPVALARVPLERAGAASGQFNTTVQLANAIGAAALGTLFFEVAARHLTAGPADAFGRGFLLVLLVGIAMMGVVIAATRIVPEDVQNGLQPGAH